VEYHILKNRWNKYTTFCGRTREKREYSRKKQAGRDGKLPVDTGRGILYNNHYAV
jgi:hypothetical protein